VVGLELTGNPTHRTRINIDGFVTLALQLQQPQVTLVLLVKAGLFRWIHDKLLRSKGPELGCSKELYLEVPTDRNCGLIFSAALAA